MGLLKYEIKSSNHRSFDGFYPSYQNG